MKKKYNRRYKAEKVHNCFVLLYFITVFVLITNTRKLLLLFSEDKLMEVLFDAIFTQRQRQRNFITNPFH